MLIPSYVLPLGFPPVLFSGALPYVVTTFNNTRNSDLIAASAHGAV